MRSLILFVNLLCTPLLPRRRGREKGRRGGRGGLWHDGEDDARKGDGERYSPPPLARLSRSLSLRSFPPFLPSPPARLGALRTALYIISVQSTQPLDPLWLMDCSQRFSFSTARAELQILICIPAPPSISPPPSLGFSRLKRALFAGRLDSVP